MKRVATKFSFSQTIAVTFSLILLFPEELSTATSVHLGLVLSVNLVKQGTKHKHGPYGSHRLDYVSKQKGGQADTKHLSRCHNDGENNRTKLQGRSKESV